MIKDVCFPKINFSSAVIQNIASKSNDLMSAKRFDLPGYEALSGYQSKAFSKFPSSDLELEKIIFGYSTKDSMPLTPYKGSLDKSAGFSTESGGYGGGWLIGDIDTPLSTKNVFTCAVAQLVDEKSGKQFLYHVHHATPVCAMNNFLKEKFASFSKVNILPGSQFETQKTTKNILSVINDINPDAQINFFYSPVEYPEIVAYQKGLNFIPTNKKSPMTFVELNQYDNIISKQF